MAIRRALPDLSAAGFGGGGIPRLLWLSSTVPKKTLRETAQLQRIIIAVYIFCSDKPISSIKPKPLGLGTRYTQAHHSPLQFQQGGVTLPCSTTSRHPSLHIKAVWNGVKNWCKEVVFCGQHDLCVGSSRGTQPCVKLWCGFRLACRWGPCHAWFCFEHTSSTQTGRRLFWKQFKQYSSLLVQ